MRFLSALLLLSAPLLAQTKLVPELDFRALPIDAVLVNVKAGGQAAVDIILRAPICQDRTGVTCAMGELFMSATLDRLVAKIPAAGPGGGQRFKCQNPIVPTADANQAVLAIAEASFSAESLQVFLNGVKQNGGPSGNPSVDYVVNGTNVTLNRKVTTQSVMQLCYAFGG